MCDSREYAGLESFQVMVRNVVKSLSKPFYAFNKSFEEKMLNISVERELALALPRSKSRYGIEKKKYAVRIQGL